MRILHVSDLHLGRAFGDLSREPEQRALVRELVLAARELDVSLTLVAGDVFDAFTPPAWAEDLFFELLDGLAEGGARAVAVIAGNHDSGMRLSAADPLARRLGIVLAGDVSEVLRGHDAGSKAVRVEPLAPQVVRIEVPNASCPAVVGLLPFVSEARVPREPGAGNDGADAEAMRYARFLERALAARTVPHPSAVHLLVMHQFVTGGQVSDSERTLRIGALADLPSAAIPRGVDYVALGHLHRPQPVALAPSMAVYAGSPIAYSFSEVGLAKRAVLVEVEPGRPARLSDVPLTSGRPLEIWEIASFEEARERASASREVRPIVEVRAAYGRRLGRADHDALFNLEGPTVASVRDAFDAPPFAFAMRDDTEGDLRVEELFRELWQRKHGEPPDDETVRELLAAVETVAREGAD